jgi:hypothetical protein
MDAYAFLMMIIFDNHTTNRKHGQYKNLTIQNNRNNWERLHSYYDKEKEGKNFFEIFLF